MPLCSPHHYAPIASWGVGQSFLIDHSLASCARSESLSARALWLLIELTVWVLCPATIGPGNRDDGRQLRVPGSSIMIAGSANVGRSPWERCEVGIVGRYARWWGLSYRVPVCLYSLQFLTEVLASEHEVRLGEATLASSSTALSPARRSPPMAVGRRRPRDTQASMQGAARRTRTLRLGVGRRCVIVGIFCPSGPVAGPPWALHAKLGSRQ